MIKSRKRLTLQWVILTIGIVIALILSGFYYYAKNYGGNYLFDMEEIVGVSDNNPYGIRNDVYTKAVDILDREAKRDSDYNHPEVRNLFLNYVKSRLLANKYFSNEFKVKAIATKSMIMMDCLFNRKMGLIDAQVVEYQDSEIEKVIFNTKDLQLIHQIINTYYFQDSIDKANIIIRQKDPEICKNLMSKVLDEDAYFE